MKLKYFELAKQLSFKSDHHSHKLGSVIVKKNKVIGLGFNKYKTHTKSNHPFRHVHAEFDALIGCSREDLLGASIYVYRQTKSGIPAIAKPCASCMSMLTQSGISDIFYSIEGGYEHLWISK